MLHRRNVSKFVTMFLIKVCDNVSNSEAGFFDSKGLFAKTINQSKHTSISKQHSYFSFYAFGICGLFQWKSNSFSNMQPF
ncbi:hypothetical protein VNO78_10560 [Psophocarpus tetragonolobus]|uniref:Uncharacterized protein n=1 Tax=Psophocarpus tetragonolobus TaxID=3891 RepID=A0AAN9SKX5_PSOTE